MTDENRHAAIGLELRHAALALEAAKLLRDAKLYDDSLSRLYYAVFHVMTALLLTEGVEVRRHAALAGLLGQHFVMPGILTAADVAAVSRIGGFRELADYERTWNATLELVDEALGVALPLIDRVRAILVKGGWATA